MLQHFRNSLPVEDLLRTLLRFVLFLPVRHLAGRSHQTLLISRLLEEKVCQKALNPSSPKKHLQVLALCELPQVSNQLVEPALVSTNSGRAPQIDIGSKLDLNRQEVWELSLCAFPIRRGLGTGRIAAGQ